MTVGEGVCGCHYFLGFVSKLQEHGMLDETQVFVMEKKPQTETKKPTMFLTVQEKELKPQGTSSPFFHGS